ncbi:MAG TPA: hypothetical protein VGH11_11440 [Jatrophihabitans sp.]
MEEPLVCEDTDLHRLLETIQQQHGDRAEILYQDSVRRGGLFGFFAREVHRAAFWVRPDGVPAGSKPAHTDLNGTDLASTDLASTDLASTDLASTELAGFGSPLVDDGRSTDDIDATGPLSIEDLIAQADEAETVAAPGAGSSDFAAVLQALTAQHEPAPIAQYGPALTMAAQPAFEAASNVTALPDTSARGKLATLMKLREVGVPVAINPRGEAHSIYHAMEEILAELPAAPTLPRTAGQILALVGELTPTLRTAAHLATQLRIDETEIVIAGLAGHPITEVIGGGRHAAESVNLGVLNTPSEAAAAHTVLAELDTPSIVVIATDTIENDPDDIWPAEMLRALQPTTAWLNVDATRKVEDNRSALERISHIGRIDAVAVHSAQLTASPATVWDLGLPIALLDGRPATTFVWSGLLLGALRNSDDQPMTGQHSHAAATA